MHFSEANFVASMRDPLGPLLSCACGCKFMIHALITEPHKSISLNKKKCLLLQLSLLLFIKKPSAKSNREPSLSCLPAVPKLFSIIWIRWEDSNSEFMMILFLERSEMKWSTEIWIYKRWRVNFGVNNIQIYRSISIHYTLHWLTALLLCLSSWPGFHYIHKEGLGLIKLSLQNH